MQRSQRSSGNLALNLAIEQAGQLRQPVYCYFALDDSYPLATARSHRFLLEGLRDVAAGLAKRNVGFVLRRSGTVPGIVDFARAVRASLVVTDESYLRFGRRRRHAASLRLAELDIPLWQVDNDLVVPVRAMGREHYAARTIRGHLQGYRDEYLHAIPHPTADINPAAMSSDLLLDNLDRILADLAFVEQVPPSPSFAGGEVVARQRLHDFLRGRFGRYHEQRNDAATDVTSHLSPYLHFGQIDPWSIALAVGQADASLEAKNGFLEELLIRRELAANFTFYNSAYDRMASLPEWARKTLADHESDPRPALYSRDELARAATGDELWNAAQRELLVAGVIHNWVRMYWGKRIIEWTRTPAEALAHTIHLNNLYALDGRDSASYANIAWCFGKHDRPWPRHPIFGTVRTMTAAGARRKFDVAGYIRRIDALTIR